MQKIKYLIRAALFSALYAIIFMAYFYFIPQIDVSSIYANF